MNKKKEPAMSEFKVNQILVKRNTFNQPSKSKSLWKVVYVYTDAVEVVPLKDGKELKMLQGIYGSAMFNPASNEEKAAGHRIESSNDQAISDCSVSNLCQNDTQNSLPIKQENQDMGDDSHTENHISPHCQSKDV
ncbi:hypothetical protein [Acinetobacter baumannii]|uniref:hypothetical protein n=1 Tax=Acinetobacter baumannii TaxID=470 RepID=UPI003CF2C59A